MKKHFFLFRHGQSTYNVQGLLQGRTNSSELTDLGKKQAFKTGKALKTYPLEVIFSSPLKRARQTADIVTEVLQVPVYTDEHFTEVDIGEAEGMHFTKVKEL